MKYVTSVERLAIERGMQKGLEKGLEKGLIKGLEKGREEGRAQGSRALLARQLTIRFGPLPAPVAERLARATPEQLECWAERVLDARSLDDVFTEN